MADVVYLRPSDQVPEERHIHVVIHRDHMPEIDRGYFYDSAEGDSGGSGPFDWNMNEAIDRAKTYADSKGIRQVVVKAKLP